MLFMCDYFPVLFYAIEAYWINFIIQQENQKKYKSGNNCHGVN